MNQQVKKNLLFQKDVFIFEAEKQSHEISQLLPI